MREEGPFPTNERSDRGWSSPVLALVLLLTFPNSFIVYNRLHYAPFIGIGSGHRQIIAVTCIAEHA